MMDKAWKHESACLPDDFSSPGECLILLIQTLHELVIPIRLENAAYRLPNNLLVNADATTKEYYEQNERIRHFVVKSV